MPPKRFMVVPRTPAIQEKGVKTGKGHRKFSGSKFWVSDPAEAAEIDQTVGLKGTKQVWVHEDPMFEWHLKNEGSSMDGRHYDIHHYIFQGVDTSHLKKDPDKDEYEWVDRGNGKQVRMKKKVYASFNDWAGGVLSEVEVNDEEETQGLQGQSKSNSGKTGNQRGARRSDSGERNAQGQPSGKAAQPTT